jgi:hypothetical protein
MSCERGKRPNHKLKDEKEQKQGKNGDILWESIRLYDLLAESIAPMLTGLTNFVGCCGGSDIVRDGDPRMDEAHDPSKGQGLAVHEPTRCFRLGVWHGPSKQQREPDDECDPICSSNNNY